MIEVYGLRFKFRGFEQESVRAITDSNVWILADDEGNAREIGGHLGAHFAKGALVLFETEKRAEVQVWQPKATVSAKERTRLEKKWEKKFVESVELTEVKPVGDLFMAGWRPTALEANEQVILWTGGKDCELMTLRDALKLCVKIAKAGL